MRPYLKFFPLGPWFLLIQLLLIFLIPDEVITGPDSENPNFPSIPHLTSLKIKSQ